MNWPYLFRGKEFASFESAADGALVEIQEGLREL